MPGVLQFNEGGNHLANIAGSNKAEGITMANDEQLAILKQGVEAWNKWREDNPDIHPDLKEALLFSQNLSGANLSGANLLEVDLHWANLSKANLSGAILCGVDLFETNLSGADLREANLLEANLHKANLSGADLRGAKMYVANLVQANLSKANFTNCRIYGISVWDAQLEGTIQQDLIITQEGQPVVTVDNLEVAQFIYLLIHNEKLRDVIDTVGKKAVLILGRFADERKAVLDAIRDELRKRNYVPILFDFEKPASRGLSETVSLLAHMARFIIADITDAKSIPQELQAIVPNLPSVAVQPIIHVDGYEYAMFEHFQWYPWVLEVHQYQDQAQLIAEISEKVIEPAEAKVNELRPG